MHFVIGSILSCGYGYHVDCFAQAKKCWDGIKYHCKIFQNTLNKALDDSVEEDDDDLGNQKDLQELILIRKRYR